MKLLHLFQLYLCVFVGLAIYKSYAVFYDCEDARYLSLSSVMHLLGRVYPGCQQVDIQTEWVICEVNNEQDAIMLTEGSSTCGQSTCPDGSMMKTCYPVSSSHSAHQYDCVCESVLNPDMIEDETYWGDWEKGTWNDYVHRRQLLIGTPPTCLMEEYLKKDFAAIIYTAGFTDPDSLYSASSDHGWFHEAFRARFGAHTSAACAWCAANGDSALWLQISLPVHPVYLVRGTMIKKRCDWPFDDQRPNVIDITTSSDDLNWQDVLLSHDITNSYTNGETSVWFDSASTNRYWKIHIVEFHAGASMKCDLLGYQM